MVDAVVARIEAEDRAAEARREADRQRAQQAMRESVADRHRSQAQARALEMEEQRRYSHCCLLIAPPFVHVIAFGMRELYHVAEVWLDVGAIR